MPRIIQISACSSEDNGETIYGLSEGGDLYFWGSIELTKGISGVGIYGTPGYVPWIKATYKQGWILMEDKINS